MNNYFQSQYIPDYVSPAGETLLEVLEERGMSQAELAQRTGRPKKTINEIIQGKTAITPETAIQLERVLGISADFWITREQHYRQYLAQLEEKMRLSGQVDWLQQFPIKMMTKLEWIQPFQDEVQQLCELLNFFGVASPEAWDTVWGQPSATFRRTFAFQSNREDVSAWLRRGEIEAQEIYCQPFEAKTFYETLIKIRSLTLDSPEIFQPELRELCAEAGVAVTFVRQLPKARVSGATRWLNPNKALIQLSLRYKTDDHLWFTFFHEAGHIVLHGKRNVYLENSDDVGQTQEQEEQEANNFAARILIPPAELAVFLKTLKPGLYPSKQAIRAFAARLGIAPGIVVGRLQHDGYIPYTHCNDLKVTFDWAD